MQIITRAIGAFVFLASLLSAQAAGPGHCTGMMPLMVPTAVNSIGQQTCSVGFIGAIGDIGVKVQSAGCPMMLVITPAHADVQWQQGALTDAQVTGQVPNFLVTFKCVSHYLLVIWLYDTCEVDDIRTAGNVDNYGLVQCVPIASTGS